MGHETLRLEGGDRSWGHLFFWTKKMLLPVVWGRGGDKGRLQTWMGWLVSSWWVSGWGTFVLDEGHQNSQILTISLQVW